MRGVARIDRGDVLPLAAAERGKREKVARRRIERPHAAAMGMRRRSDLLACEIDAVGKTAAGPVGRRLDQNGRAEPREAAGNLELARAGDKVAGAIVDRPDGDAGVDDRHGRDIEVEVRDARAGEASPCHRPRPTRRRRGPSPARD